MYVWMYVCMYVWMDGWMDGWMYGWMDGWMDVCMDVCMYGWMDGWMDVWMDGWMDGCLYTYLRMSKSVQSMNKRKFHKGFDRFSSELDRFLNLEMERMKRMEWMEWMEWMDSFPGEIVSSSDQPNLVLWVLNFELLWKQYFTDGYVPYLQVETDIFMMACERWMMIGPSELNIAEPPSPSKQKAFGWTFSLTSCYVDHGGYIQI